MIVFGTKACPRLCWIEDEAHRLLGRRELFVPLFRQAFAVEMKGERKEFKRSRFDVGLEAALATAEFAMHTAGRLELSDLGVEFLKHCLHFFIFLIRRH